MKIRVTLMTENDKHSGLPKQVLEEIARGAWEMMLHLLSNNEDKAVVEKVELIED